MKIFNRIKNVPSYCFVDEQYLIDHFYFNADELEENSAEGCLLERKEIDGKVYYRNKNLRLFDEY